jgi:shikimate kinase
MILKLKRTPGLYLVGFMASGKTTIGRRLADELGWDFADLDEDIVAAQGAEIVEIFDSLGEEEFRKTEHAAIRKRVGQIERGRPMVVALGGGTFVSEVIQEFLIENGITIWLDCPFERVSTRIQGSSHRPLARDPEKFERLYHARREAYGKAEYRIEIQSDDPADVVAAILKLPVF